MKKIQFRSPKDPKSPTVEEFSLMVESHDPTWVWSRDPEERAKGETERRIIEASRKVIGDQKAVEIWNRSMHKKVVPAMLLDFLWTVRRPKKA